MSEVLAALLFAGVVALWTYRQIQLLRTYRRWHGLPFFPRFRGLRLVVSNHQPTTTTTTKGWTHGH